MRKERFAGFAGFKMIIIFLIIGSIFYHLIQRPIRASDWDKVNLLSCTRMNNQEILCKQRHSVLFGLFPENKEFKLLEVNIKKYEGGEDPDKYVLHIKTNNEMLEIDDYGDDYERIYKVQTLLRSVFREHEISTVTVKYADGFIKTSLIWSLGLFAIYVAVIVCH